MRKKTNHLIFPFLLMGLFLVFASSCKKDENNSNNNNTGIPILTTTAVTDITRTTAKSGGIITSNGGAAVTSRGVCWSTNQTPTISDNKTTDGTGEGNFTSSMSGLSGNTHYYVRAYATNSNGTGYGNTMSFTTLEVDYGSFTDSRDGNVYKTVTIGNQVWMAENLKYLPSVTGPGTSSQTSPYYYVYGINSSNVNAAKATPNYATYGVLYNWTAACNSCPAGWHLPNDAEWTTLTTYLAGESEAGGKLKETGTTHWYSPNSGATNQTGFTALPGGVCDNTGSFYNIGLNGVWWSATEYDASTAGYRHLGYDYSYMGKAFNPKELGYSVRCIKN